MVSGLPQDKPSDAALAAASAVWVAALGETDAASTPGLSLFRTMLPSPGFARAVQNVPTDSSPASAEAVMQQNYPKGVYCQALRRVRCSGRIGGPREWEGRGGGGESPASPPTLSRLG